MRATTAGSTLVVNTTPRASGRSCASIVPPCASAMRRAMCRPSPRCGRSPRCARTETSESKRLPCMVAGSGGPSFATASVHASRDAAQADLDAAVGRREVDRRSRRACRASARSARGAPRSGQGVVRRGQLDATIAVNVAIGRDGAAQRARAGRRARAARPGCSARRASPRSSPTGSRAGGWRRPARGPRRPLHFRRADAARGSRATTARRRAACAARARACPRGSGGTRCARAGARAAS